MFGCLMLVPGATVTGGGVGDGVIDIMSGGVLPASNAIVLPTKSFLPSYCAHTT